MLKVDTSAAQSRTCTSAKALEQHLRGRRHLKKAHQLAGLPPPVKQRKKKAKGPEVISKKCLSSNSKKSFLILVTCGWGVSGLDRKHGCLHTVPPFPYCTFLRAWNRLIRAENFQKLFEAADEDVNFSHQRLVDLLTLSAAKGGTQEFADALRLVVKEGGV